MAEGVGYGEGNDPTRRGGLWGTHFRFFNDQITGFGEGQHVASGGIVARSPYAKAARGAPEQHCGYSQRERRVPGWMMVASRSGPVEIMPISTFRKSATKLR